MLHHNSHSITYLSDPARFAVQEKQYLDLREKEGMVLRDELVRLLPDLPKGHPLSRLWHWRRASLRRLIRHLQTTYRDGNLHLLDLGCGNGWMSNQFSQHLSAEVWGVDVNRIELEQAARLFEFPRFYFADIFGETLPGNYFDVVVLAGSIQYFSNLDELFTALKRVLKPDGVIHIIDTNFYLNEQLRAKAVAATQNYYAGLGMPEMAGFYHHHLLEDVGGANLNDRLWIRFLQKIKVLSPFPWIRVGV